MESKTLVIADAAERHPFRAGLPPEERRGRARRDWPISATSVREFLMAYCACFLAVSLFIA